MKVVKVYKTPQHETEKLRVLSVRQMFLEMRIFNALAPLPP